MLRTFWGIYRAGKIELAEQPDNVGDNTPVIVTFLEPNHVDLRAYGLEKGAAAELRARLATFAEDWDNSEMDGYEWYELVVNVLQNLDQTLPSKSK